MLYFSSIVSLREVLVPDVLSRILEGLLRITGTEIIETHIEDTEIFDTRQPAGTEAKNQALQDFSTFLLNQMQVGEIEIMSFELKQASQALTDGSTGSYEFYYSIWGPEIDFWIPEHWFCSRCDSELNFEIDLPDQFQIYFKSVRAIIRHTDPWLVIGEAEGYSVQGLSHYRINQDLAGIPIPGRISFFGREIVEIINHTEDNHLLWQEALAQTAHHESLLGGELIYLGPDEDTSDYLLTWLTEKVRAEQSGKDLTALRQRPIRSVSQDSKSGANRVTFELPNGSSGISEDPESSDGITEDLK